MYHIAFLPILGAGILSAFIGFLWYHPKFFGGAWTRMTNLTPEMIEKGKKRMPFMGIIGVVASMLAAYVMAYVGIAVGVYDWIGAIEVGVWCWLGFVVPTMLGQVLWEQKRFALYLINVSYWLVAFIAMSLVLWFF